MVDSRQLVYSELNPLKVSQEQEQEQQNLEGNLQIEKLLELEMVLVMQLDLEQEQELLMMGFVSAVTHHMRAFVPSIYDRTVAIMLPRWLPNSMPQINVQIKRHSMQELPGTADGIA
ncbi:hypothetical protein LINPERPRIM_LOCUS41707 [Linum perenne]